MEFSRVVLKLIFDFRFMFTRNTLYMLSVTFTREGIAYSLKVLRPLLASEKVLRTT